MTWKSSVYVTSVSAVIVAEEDADVQDVSPVRSVSIVEKRRIEDELAETVTDTT